MRIRVKKTLTYQKSTRKTAELYPGEYEVGTHISLHLADLALKFGSAEIIPDVEKVAPENKAVEAPENKA